VIGKRTIGVVLRIPITQLTFLNEGMLLLRSNHILIYGSFINVIIIFFIFTLSRSQAYLGEQKIYANRAVFSTPKVYLCSTSPLIWVIYLIWHVEGYALFQEHQGGVGMSRL